MIFLLTHASTNIVYLLSNFGKLKEYDELSEANVFP